MKKIITISRDEKVKKVVEDSPSSDFFFDIFPVNYGEEVVTRILVKKGETRHYSPFMKSIFVLEFDEETSHIEEEAKIKSLVISGNAKISRWERESFRFKLNGTEIITKGHEKDVKKVKLLIEERSLSAQTILTPKVKEILVRLISDYFSTSEEKLKILEDRLQVGKEHFINETSNLILFNGILSLSDPREITDKEIKPPQKITLDTPEFVVKSLRRVGYTSRYLLQPINSFNLDGRVINSICIEPEDKGIENLREGNRIIIREIRIEPGGACFGAWNDIEVGKSFSSIEIVTAIRVTDYRDAKTIETKNEGEIKTQHTREPKIISTPETPKEETLEETEEPRIKEITVEEAKEIERKNSILEDDVKDIEISPLPSEEESNDTDDDEDTYKKDTRKSDDEEESEEKPKLPKQNNSPSPKAIFIFLVMALFMALIIALIMWTRNKEPKEDDE
jgi:hypothetical protein